MDDLITLKVYQDRDLAWRTKSMLFANGIFGQLNSESAELMNFTKEVRLQIRAADYERAKSLVETFLARQH